jgi:hypothetical protein
MPVDYFAIIKKAYSSTLRHPGLWLLGLFLSGGFNANVFYLANLDLGWRDRLPAIINWLEAQLHTSTLTMLIVGTAVIAALIIFVTNWAKVLFILYAGDVLQIEHLSSPSSGYREIDQHETWKQRIKQGKRVIYSVIGVSLFTMISLMIISAIIFGLPGQLFEAALHDSFGGLLSVLIFAMLVLFFSCLNIFANFFIVFYQRNFSVAINLALDLIRARWTVILEMAVLLLVIYMLCFFVGSSLIYLLKVMSTAILVPLGHLSALSETGVFNSLTIASGLLLWMWLAIVNTFFNLSLLLLFKQLVRPSKGEELKRAEKVPVPVPNA